MAFNSSLMHMVFYLVSKNLNATAVSGKEILNVCS